MFETVFGLFSLVVIELFQDVQEAVTEQRSQIYSITPMKYLTVCTLDGKCAYSNDESNRSIYRTTSY